MLWQLALLVLRAASLSMPGRIFVALEWAQQTGVPLWCEHACGRGAALRGDTGEPACHPLHAVPVDQADALASWNVGPPRRLRPPAALWSTDAGHWDRSPEVRLHLWGQAPHVVLRRRLQG